MSLDEANNMPKTKKRSALPDGASTDKAAAAVAGASRGDNFVIDLTVDL